jgi:hypothetical protein
MKNHYFHSDLTIATKNVIEDEMLLFVWCHLHYFASHDFKPIHNVNIKRGFIILERNTYS